MFRGSESFWSAIPYYWKEDRNGVHLPYVNELVFLFVASEDAQVIRFQSGDTDILSRFSADDFSVLERNQDAKGLSRLRRGTWA